MYSHKEDLRPSVQWYWDDWFSEFGLRMCSLEARGLWVDMLGIMFNAQERGQLTVNGNRINEENLAKICNTDTETVRRLWQELENNNVFSRLKNGHREKHWIM